jgi:endonuclease-3
LQGFVLSEKLIMTQKEKKINLLKIIELLEKEYPTAECSLNYEDPFHLLVATRLAAQCTDARVNMVAPALFKAFPTPEAFSKATVEEVEGYIKSCGLFHSKARDLVRLGKVLTQEFNSVVPNNMKDLTSLPGIGRKTANLILGDVFGLDGAVVTDTHFIRLCNRMGFVNFKEPKKVEDAMRKLLPPKKSNDFCHRTVMHGRAVCTARIPKCDICILKDICAKKI